VLIPRRQLSLGDLAEPGSALHAPVVPPDVGEVGRRCADRAPRTAAARTISARAQVCWAGVHSVPPDDHDGFGRRPVAVALRLSDDSVVEVVTAGYERLALVGPYLAAAINDLPDTRFRHTGFDVRARQPDDHDERWH